MLQARQVRLHGVVRGRLSWAARDEARPVDAEQLADVGDVGPEGGDYLAEVLLHALHEPCGLLGAVRQDVRATAFFGILSAMRRLLSGFAVRYYSAFREKSPLFFCRRENNLTQCLRGAGDIRDNLSRIFPG